MKEVRLAPGGNNVVLGLGSVVREACRLRGISVAELCLHVGLDKSAARSIHSGLFDSRLVTWAKQIARRLDIHPNLLMAAHMADEVRAFSQGQDAQGAEFWTRLGDAIVCELGRSTEVVGYAALSLAQTRQEILDHVSVDFSQHPAIQELDQDDDEEENLSDFLDEDDRQRMAQIEKTHFAGERSFLLDWGVIAMDVAQNPELYHPGARLRWWAQKKHDMPLQNILAAVALKPGWWVKVVQEMTPEAWRFLTHTPPGGVPHFSMADRFAEKSYEAALSQG